MNIVINQGQPGERKFHNIFRFQVKELEQEGIPCEKYALNFVTTVDEAGRIKEIPHLVFCYKYAVI